MEKNISPMTTSNKVLVILVNFNGKNDTLECLASLRKIPNITPVIVDNGSCDDSVAVFQSHHPQIKVFETGENLGFAGGNNVAITWGLKKGFDWILLLNNDTIIDPSCIEGFLEAAKKEPKGKIFGAKIFLYNHRDIVDHLGGMWNPNIGDFVSFREDTETMKQVDYVCGAAFFMHRSVPEKVGLLEPSFFLFWEETDYCYRAKKEGMEIWTAPKAKVWHKVSSSFMGGKPQMHYYWWRSRLLWIHRNIKHPEKRTLYWKVIFPDLWKTLRHFVLFKIKRKHEKAKRNLAGLLGAFHYFIGKFGPSPSSLK